MNLYQLTSNTHYVEGNYYVSYGISWNNDQINDISLEKNAIEQLVALCNMLKLDCIHIIYCGFGSFVLHL